jgi:hypothetical protein
MEKSMKITRIRPIYLNGGQRLEGRGFHRGGKIAMKGLFAG